MPPAISPRAMVHSSAIIDSSRGAVVVMDDATIGPHCVIVGPVWVGRSATIDVGCVVGSLPEHRSGEVLWSPVSIGDRSVLREYVVVQRGIASDAIQTSVGADCYLMHGCHVGHNSRIEDHVTMAPYVVLAGHSAIHRGATLGIGSATHQRSTVGAYAMVGMGVEVQRDVHPGAKIAAVPAKQVGWNSVGMERHGVTEEELAIERARFESVQTRRTTL